MTDGSSEVVLDASVLVDLLAGTDLALSAAKRIRGTSLHAPAHLDAEVLSALGRLNRAGRLSDGETASALERMTDLPITRHPLPDLLSGAWQHRSSIRLVDALYVQLATDLNSPLLTTDLRLARSCSMAEPIEG